MSFSRSTKTRSPIFGDPPLSGGQQQQQLTQPPAQLSSHHQPIDTNRLLQQRVRVPCHYHPPNTIQNFCEKPDCLIPLCPECVDIHQKEHREWNDPGQFRELNSCITAHQQKLIDNCNNLSEDIERVNAFKSDIRNARQIQQQKLSEAKVQFYQYIEKYFQQLESKLDQSSNQITEQLLLDTNNMHRKLYERWETYNERLQQLGTDQCLKALIKCYKHDQHHKYTNSHAETHEFLQHTKTQIRSLQIDHTQLPNFNELMQKYMYITDTTPIITHVATNHTSTQQTHQVQHVEPEQPISQVVNQAPLYTFPSTSPARVLSGFPMYHHSPINQLKGLQSTIQPQLFQQPQLIQQPQLVQQPHIHFQPPPPQIQQYSQAVIQQPQVQQAQVIHQIPAFTQNQFVQGPPPQLAQIPPQLAQIPQYVNQEFTAQQEVIRRVTQMPEGFVPPGQPYQHSRVVGEQILQSQPGQVIQLEQTRPILGQFNRQEYAPVQFPKQSAYLGQVPQTSSDRQDAQLPRNYEFSPRIDHN